VAFLRREKTKKIVSSNVGGDQLTGIAALIFRGNGERASSSKPDSWGDANYGRKDQPCLREQGFRREL